MTRLLGKLGFIHRRLWQRDGLYRISMLIGPAPLLGGVAAAGLWAVVMAIGGFGAFTVQKPPAQWAVPAEAKDNWPTGANQLNVAEPYLPLPSVGADGVPQGFRAGWAVVTRPVQITPTYNAIFENRTLSSFFLEGPVVAISRLAAEGPKDVQFLAFGVGLLAVKSASIYALSARFERPAGPVANCLVLLAFAGRRILSSIDVNISLDHVKEFPPARFNLQPGLYSVAWEFACWHNKEMTGPGKFTVLIGHPGETGLTPMRPGDIVMKP